MFESLDIWRLLAGLGIFLFGMFLMEESIKNLGGRSFKSIIRRFTKTRLKAILSGTLVTAVLQSSSAVSLMVLAFVGAGMMAMENAIGVIFGSNIGTTATAWLVAFFGFKVNIEDYSLPLIAIGGLGLIFLANSVRYSNLSKLLAGFGFLFMGLDFMKSSVLTFAENFDITSIPDIGVVGYALIGLVLTAIMQSSSATIAIVLTTLNAQIIDFHAAAGMVIGANVGTTVTVILGTIGGSQIKKRVALSHTLFNVTTAIIGLLTLPLVAKLILLILGPKADDAVMGVALYQTIFNVGGVLIFLPFIGLFAKLLIKALPDKVTKTTLFIHKVSADVSDAAIAALHNETLNLIINSLHFNLRVHNIDPKTVIADDVLRRKGITLKTIQDEYDWLKNLQSEIFSFASSILAGDVSKEESKLIQSKLHSARMALHAAKSIKDVAHNFDEFESSDSQFLREKNALFRVQTKKFYSKLMLVVNEENHVDIAGDLMAILKKLRKKDRMLVKEITSATSRGDISNIDISNILIVNRAVVQSTRETVLSVRELLLTESESQLFEELNDVENTVIDDTEP